MKCFVEYRSELPIRVSLSRSESRVASEKNDGTSLSESVHTDLKRPAFRKFHNYRRDATRRDAARVPIMTFRTWCFFFNSAKRAFRLFDI